MFVNNTKTTLPVFRIAIAYNNEEGFAVISKIIQLFRWLKLNVIFEPIDIAGQNYEKKMKYGIDEDNLRHLKQTNIFLHTSFDYSSFDKTIQIDANQYLNIALQNYFTKSFSFQEDTNNFALTTSMTNFFEKNREYIANINDYNFLMENLKQQSNTNEDGRNEYDFYYAFGAKYAIFSLNKMIDKVVMRMTIELLHFLRFNEQATLLNNFKNLDDAVSFLKQQNKDVFLSISVDKINMLPEIVWKDINTIVPDKIVDVETTLCGKFQINDLVALIKERRIKLPEKYELYQILSNDIEYYPNINFWNDVIFNPVIKLINRDA